MKQLLQSLKSGETYVEDVPVPVARPGTALVRTAVSLVSAGTERMVVDFAQKSLLGKARTRPDIVRQVIDKARREGVLPTIQAAFNRLDHPMPLGYSSAGTIVEMGAGLSGFQPGDRVACAGGGWAVHAEYVVVPQNLITRLPETVDFEQAAFATLGAIAMHGFRLTGVQIGATVAVIGMGLLGQLAAAIASAAGCQVLGIDLDERRVDLARRMGISSVLRGEAEGTTGPFTHDRGFDAVLICADTSSDDPVELAGEIARDRATVVAVGAVGQNLPRRAYFAKELTFLNSRSYGPGRYDPNYEEKGQDYPPGYVRWTEGRNLEAFVDLLAAGRIDVSPLITHRFPIEQAPEAYELIQGRRDENFLGVLITYAESNIEDQRSNIEDRRSKIDGQSSPTGGRPARSGGDTAGPHRDSRSSNVDLRLGVLGAGNFATAVMLPAVRKIEGVNLVGIASASGLNARHAAKKFGFEFETSREEDILANEQINTVAVLTRHDRHAAQVLAAFEAGKHVFCEKPLALHPEELLAIEEGYAAHPDVIWTVGFNRRFAPFSRPLKAFVRQSGEPAHITYRVNAGFLPPDHWLHDLEQGGGRIVGEACHFIDYLTFLLAQPPIDVTAHALPDEGRYWEDNVQMTFTYPDGSIGTVIYLANGDKSVPKERVEVFSGGRVAVLDDFRSLEMVAGGRRQVKRARLSQDKGHRAIWEAFAHAVRERTDPPIPCDQLFAVSWATFAAVQALHTGRTVEVATVRGRYEN